MTALSAGIGLAPSGLGWLAIDCPVCNKVLVALLGLSVTLTVFEPLERYLSMVSVALPGVALVIRIRAIAAACPLPAQ